MKNISVVLLFLLFLLITITPGILGQGMENYAYPGEEESTRRWKKDYYNAYLTINVGLHKIDKRIKSLEDYTTFTSHETTIRLTLLSITLLVFTVLQSIKPQYYKTKKYILPGIIVILQILLLICTLVSDYDRKQIEIKTNNHGTTGLLLLYKNVSELERNIKHNLNENTSEFSKDKLMYWQSDLSYQIREAESILINLKISRDRGNSIKPKIIKIDNSKLLKRYDQSKVMPKQKSYSLTMAYAADYPIFLKDRKDKPCWIDKNLKECGFPIERYIYIISNIESSSKKEAILLTQQEITKKLFQISKPTLKSLCDSIYGEKQAGHFLRLLETEFKRSILKYGKEVRYFEAIDDQQLIFHMLFEIDPAALEYLLFDLFYRYKEKELD